MEPLMIIQIATLVIAAVILISLYWQDRKKQPDRPKRKKGRSRP